MSAPSVALEPPSAPHELFLRGHAEPVGFACPACGLLFLLVKDDLADPKQVKELSDRARLHCYRFCPCGAPVERPYWLRCDPCIKKEEAKKEAARFEKAQKISIEDYPDQPVFWGSRGPHDGYFEDVAALLDYCEDDAIEPPKWVWAAKPTDFQIDGGEAIDRALEMQEHCEAVCESIPNKARKTLETLLGAWSQELNLRTWHQDVRRVVLLSSDEG